MQLQIARRPNKLWAPFPTTLIGKMKEKVYEMPKNDEYGQNHLFWHNYIEQSQNFIIFTKLFQVISLHQTKSEMQSLIKSL